MHTRLAPRNALRLTALAGCVLGLSTAARADQAAPDLAGYFGWEEPRIIVVDRGTGPALAADMNADGLKDLVIVNNSKSRIEIHAQRSTPRTEQDIVRDYKVNQLPPSPFYDRTEVSVSHRVQAFRVHDVDADGKLDIVYAGDPQELVILRQTGSLRFDVLSKRRVKDLAMGQDGLEIADVTGDPAPEVLALVGGRINVFGLSASAVTGEPIQLGSGGSGQDIVAHFVEDYNGDGLLDILAAVPDDSTPVRLWLQTPGFSTGAKSGQLGPELRFEMPALRELEPVRLPDRAASAIGVIERPTRRVVLHDLKLQTEAETQSPGVGERDASADVFAFPGGASKNRSLCVADIDSDGMLDLLAADQQGNTLLLYRQLRGVGLSSGERFSALKDPRSIASGQWDADPTLEVFVLSEADKVVGVSHLDSSTQKLSFPQPLPTATAGASPVAMVYAPLSSGPALAVVVKDKRDHTLEIHRPDGSTPVTLKLEGVSRPPQSGLAGDFDHDGATDLVLFTPGEPLVLVRSVDGPAADMKLLTDKSMPQFGLVQAAGPDNTAMLDIDNDSYAELLVADQNFVRACAFSPEKGWRVVEQATIPESGTVLTGLTVLQGGSRPTSIVAADKANKRLIVLSRGEKGWEVSERLRFSAFDTASLHAGAFGGDGAPGVLAASDSAFAVVRFGGSSYTLDEFAAFRSDSEERLEHEMEAGDLNSDGFTDIVVLDAREQMAQIFTLSRSRRIFLATEFKVFESRLFGRGDDREFEPGAAIIADVTGDGRNDLILEVHDRYMIYPQMSASK
ncbi:MAG: VCBS repeat-containing protein [Planctomycetota bacterium]|nr:VCBS repeat-containing protein [Planctomycetota bacterium]